MRKKLIAGNWKMNYTINQADEFVASIIDKINVDEVEVAICPNFTVLASVAEVIGEKYSKNVKLGAQNVHFEDKGAYTGEISADMLNAIGVDYCIIGHSERRQYFNETNADVNKKAKKLLERNIMPIICVGETLDERNENKMFEKVSTQIKEGLEGIDKENVKKNIVIAYEPIWAIGTGVTATSEQAQEMCQYIREVIKEIYNENIADAVRIQYGGSVNAKNAKEILNMPDIDGALVGGASLTNDFISIVNFDD